MLRVGQFGGWGCWRGEAHYAPRSWVMGTLDTLGSQILCFLKMMGTYCLAIFVGLGDLEKLFFTLVRC